MNFGPYIRQLREELEDSGGPFSLREVAKKVGIAPTYLSKIEREELPPPSEGIIVGIAVELGEDPDVLLAMSGKISERLKRIICKRPKLIARLLEDIESIPDEAIERISKEVRDGEW